MKNQIIKYTQIKADDVGLIRWNESLYNGTPVYIGLVNDFIVAVCTENSGNEYDTVAIRFRIRNYEIKNSFSKPASKGIIAIYRTDYILSDLNDGLWLTDAELLKINNEIDKLLDQFKIGFIAVK